MTHDELYTFLENKFYQYNTKEFIVSDPISIPHKFTLKQDIEIAGLLTATIAWGQRTTILKNANELMDLMEMSPYDFIQHHSEKDLKRFHTFKHRTFNPIDCLFFIQSLKNIYTQHTSLEDVFIGKSVWEAIASFRKYFLSISHPLRIRKQISDPLTGSAAKRLNMFLRWMVREDISGVDFGIWNTLKPHQLMCPLDVHSARVARKLGLLNRKQNDRQAVEELTGHLKNFDPNDPVKYDFALFGLGVFEKF